MSLHRKITLAFLMVGLAVVGTLLFGVPFVLSEVSMKQMNAHAKTFGLFLRNSLQSLSEHEPDLVSDSTLRERLVSSIRMELQKASLISETAGSFAVLSIDVRDEAQNEVVVWGKKDDWLATDPASTLAADASGLVLGHAARGGLVVPHVEEMIIPLAIGPRRIWTIRVYLDSAKSIELHQDQYLAFQAGSIVILLSILLSLLLVLLRFLRTTVVRPATELSRAMAAVTEGNLNVRVAGRASDEFGRIGLQFNLMVDGLRERLALNQYVSKATQRAVKQATETGQAFHPPERKELVVFFSDIRGFTTYAERRSPLEVLRILNRILDLQASVVHRFGGEIDKFIGDGTMATFLDVELAFRASLTIQILMNRRAGELDGLKVGIGLSQGPVVQGDIGSHEIRDFTVIGDTVNTAARLQFHAEAGEILVPLADVQKPSQFFWKTARQRALILKGKSMPLEVVCLVGMTKASGVSTETIPEAELLR